MPRRNRVRGEAVAGAPAANWGWAAIGGLLGLLLAISIFAPARWLAAGVASATDARVRLISPRGSVWNGSADLVLTGGTGSNDAAALPGRIDWRLRPRWDGMTLALTAACCTLRQPIALQAHMRWQGAQIVFADSTSRWPANLLTGLGTPFNTLQPQGLLELSTHQLDLVLAAGRLQVEGNAQLDALDMSSRLSPLKPMGSYRVSLGGGAVPAVALKTLSGALRMEGTGQFVGGRLHFNGEASAAPEREAALSNLLNILGRRSGARSIISVG
jgi:general secretion pathway protein N